MIFIAFLVIIIPFVFKNLSGTSGKEYRLFVYITGAQLLLNLGVGTNVDLSNVLSLSIPGELSISADISLPITEGMVKFFLYTRTVSQLELTRNNLEDITYDNTKETVFLVHGWRDRLSDEMPQVVKNAYLTSREINVIIVDWNEIAARNYFSAKYATRRVGAIIANFIQNMTEKIGVNIATISFVGFSLGAHVSGFAGKQLKTTTPGSGVKLITGE